MPAEGRRCGLARVTAAAALRPGLRAHAAYVDNASPSIRGALRGLVSEGVDDVVVLPLLLTPASHSKTDIAASVQAGRTAHPGVRLRYGRPLGPHPVLVERLVSRLVEAGARVTLVAGPVQLPTPAGVRRIDVQTAQQMLDAVMPEAPAHDIFVATAAVADWRPADAAEQKIKKDGSGLPPPLVLIENPDILAAVARLPPDQRPWCVGFAAESHDVVRHARDKRVRKGVPLMVGNIGPATFGQDDNALLLVSAAGVEEFARDSKLALARRLIGRCAELALALQSGPSAHA